MTNFKKDNPNDQRTAAVITAVYVALILSLFFLITFTKPEPPEEDGGLLVDFGYTEEGYGEQEPAMTNETPVDPTPTTENTPTQSSENLATSDVEEAVSVNKTDDSKTKVTENTEKVVQKPKEEPVLPKIEERKPNQRAIFSGFARKTGSGSEGNTKGTGNMGVPDGGESDIYQGRSTGLGNAGDGGGMIGTGLSGRKMKNIPTIEDNSNKTGKIIIKVKVDNNGNVISADFTASGSTISDNELVDKCEAAARKAHFTPNEERDVDYGTLVFTFKIK
jgi:outer membrane biosynthesis protein TonB